jgi:integrase
MKLHYTYPKIISYGGDLSRRWVVYFRFYHEGRWLKKTYSSEINTYKTKRDRMKSAIELRDAWTQLLESGFNPFLKANSITREKTLPLVIEDILLTKKSSLKPKSYRTYNDMMKMFKSWLTDNGYNFLYAHNFKSNHARSYMDHLLIDRNYVGKSHNENLGTLKTIFNAMLDRKIIDENPFKGIKKLTETSAGNVPYTESEKNQIISHCKEHHIRLYYIICFIYYCFIRRSELIQLKVKDVNLDNCTITLTSRISKNKKTESVTIPREFEKVLRDMNLQDYSPDDYIIGNRFNTCSRPILKPDSLTYAMQKVNKKLGIKGKGLYSFKHLGMCSLYETTKDPWICMRQARHYDLKVTMIYLRSLGLTVDEGVRRADFRL